MLLLHMQIRRYFNKICDKHIYIYIYLLHNPHVNGQYVLNVDVQILGSLQLTNALSTQVVVVTCCAENRLRHYYLSFII